jgi:hypothetical protein
MASLVEISWGRHAMPIFSFQRVLDVPESVVRVYLNDLAHTDMVSSAMSCLSCGRAGLGR